MVRWVAYLLAASLLSGCADDAGTTPDITDASETGNDATEDLRPDSPDVLEDLQEDAPPDVALDVVEDVIDDIVPDDGEDVQEDIAPDEGEDVV